MIILLFQHTAARRRLHAFGVINTSECNVSTHSRTKAAAYLHFSCATSRISFNTQPHEGGCLLRLVAMLDFCRFQHTAARRRLPLQVIDFIDIFLFQHTAARRRLPINQQKALKIFMVSTHSRTKAAALPPQHRYQGAYVSTHSRTKAAAREKIIIYK